MGQHSLLYLVELCMVMIESVVGVYCLLCWFVGESPTTFPWFGCAAIFLIGALYHGVVFASSLLLSEYEGQDMPWQVVMFIVSLIHSAFGLSFFEPRVLETDFLHGIWLYLVAEFLVCLSLIAWYACTSRFDTHAAGLTGRRRKT